MQHCFEPKSTTIPSFSHLKHSIFNTANKEKRHVFKPMLKHTHFLHRTWFYSGDFVSVWVITFRPRACPVEQGHCYFCNRNILLVQKLRPEARKKTSQTRGNPRNIAIRQQKIQNTPFPPDLNLLWENLIACHFANPEKSNIESLILFLIFFFIFSSAPTCAFALEDHHTLGSACPG